MLETLTGKAEKLIPLSEDPELRALEDTLSEAKRAFEKAKAEEDTLRLIISDTATHRGMVQTGVADGRAAYRPATDAEFEDARSRLRLDLGQTLPGYAYLPEARQAEKEFERASSAYQEAREKKRDAIVARRKQGAADLESRIRRDLAALASSLEKRLRYAESTQGLLDGEDIRELSAWGGARHCLEELFERHITHAERA
jgi:D-serine deaminase-like pyridoxal phosphate-dependent protein